MPHRQLLAAALAAFAIGILMQPVRAATGDATVQCITPQEIARNVHDVDPDATIILYRGGLVKLALDALIESAGGEKPPLDLDAVKAVGMYVNSDPNIGVLAQFFDAQDCNLYVTGHLSAGAWAVVRARMGTSA